VLATCDPDRTRAIVNTQKTITGDFTRDPDLVYPADSIRSRLEDALDGSRLTWIDASAIATKLLGDSIGSNLFLVGYAWQQGLIPLSRQAIFDAIELNGVKAEWNQQAFEWGRRAAHNLDAVLELIGGGAEERSRQSLDDFVEGRATDLVAYQGEAYARRYRDLVARVREVEASRAPGQSALGEAVARYAYKLMAYKDEYEVARLHSDPAFRRKLDEQFEGDFKLQFNLSPPAIAPQDKVTGLPRKMTFGSWMMPVFGLLARLKFLRGTAFDPFGRTDERKMERQLIADYENTVAELLETLTEDNHDLAVKIASADLLASWRAGNREKQAA
jgi:indolepyruvate ferredoxin oxidoreductase